METDHHFNHSFGTEHGPAVWNPQFQFSSMNFDPQMETSMSFQISFDVSCLFPWISMGFLLPSFQKLHAEDGVISGLAINHPNVQPDTASTVHGLKKLPENGFDVEDLMNEDGGFHSHGGTPNGWFRMEYPILIDDLGVAKF